MQRVLTGSALNVNQNQLKHWRRLEKDGNWRLEYKDKLFMDIGREEMTDVDKPRVLFWGKIQAGKSSFINSIASVDKGRFAQLAAVADSAKRVTRRLGILHLSNNMKNLRIIDVMGLERRGFGGLPADDVQFILRGHVRQNYEFNESDHISQENETFFKADPSDAEKAYCNVLVVSAYDVYGDLIESDMLKTLRDVQSIAHDAAINSWNNLPPDIKESETLEIFKQKLKSILYPQPEYFKHGNRTLSVYHARVRNNCSNLNGVLYMNHLTDNNTCLCKNDIETAEHFFFRCTVVYIKHKE